jgi:tetratricopeptide (TPR) repeat protein
MRLAALVAFFSTCLAAQSFQDWVNQGVQGFKNGKYPDAAAAFQKALELKPDDVTARLYLATAYMQQYIPGGETPENQANAEKAQAELQRVIDADSGNKVALASIASLFLNRKKYGEARDSYQRLLLVDPQNKEAYYSLGFLAWAQWYPAYRKVRADLGMKPEQPGPLSDPAARAALRGQWWSVLDEGMWSLNRALAIDPQYDDAMAYMNLLIRERADLRDTAGECARDVAEADQWVQKALETKRAKAARALPR